MLICSLAASHDGHTSRDVDMCCAKRQLCFPALFWGRDKRWRRDVDLTPCRMGRQRSYTDLSWGGGGSPQTTYRQDPPQHSHSYPHMREQLDLQRSRLNAACPIVSNSQHVCLPHTLSSLCVSSPLHPGDIFGFMLSSVSL